MSEPKTTTCPGGFEMPLPVAEHAWLNRFVGTWDTEGECYVGPDNPPVQLKGVETVRSLGFWIVTQITSTVPGMPYEQVTSTGYDPEKGVYIGTLVDSMTSYLWRYEGSVEGERITLFTEGPCPMAPGRDSKFRDSTEFLSDDHKVLTSEIQGEDGQWTTLMKVHSRRRK